MNEFKEVHKNSLLTSKKKNSFTFSFLLCFFFLFSFPHIFSQFCPGVKGANNERSFLGKDSFRVYFSKLKGKNSTTTLSKSILNHIELCHKHPYLHPICI